MNLKRDLGELRPHRGPCPHTTTKQGGCHARGFARKVTRMRIKRQKQNRPRPTVSLTLPKPYYDRGGIRLYHGDCLQILPLLSPGSIDAAITDPPYCSGGVTMAEKARDPQAKYCQNGNACGRPTFGGDARDQRSFGFWASLWLTECRRLVRPGGYALVFSDWRQLPAAGSGGESSPGTRDAGHVLRTRAISSTSANTSRGGRTVPA